MNLWQIINSPIVLTTVTILAGGLVASTISAMWQRRAQQHDLKFQYAREILAIYQAYVRLLNGPKDRLTGDHADELHVQMLSQAKLAPFVFRDRHVGEAWQQVAARLTNAAGFKRAGHEEKAKHRMVDVYSAADSAIQGMYMELRH